MYLRHTRVRKNGKTHTYWLLVRSVRRGSRVKQEIVARLGRLDAKGRQRAEAFEFAAGSLDNGNGWRNPETLRGIIDKIVCHFRYARKNGESYMMKSFLDSVEIYPAGGSPISLPSETQPGPAFVSEAIRRTFGPDEIAPFLPQEWRKTLEKARAAAQETYRQRREAKRP